MTAPALLSAQHLCKSFGELKAVDDVSFEVAPGEIVGLVGPNGAGKTTTINMILGVLAPTAGRIEIEGDRPGAPTAAARWRRTNFAAVYAPLPGNLTVEQNLRVFGMIYAVEGPAGADRRAAGASSTSTRFRKHQGRACCPPASRPGSASPRRCSTARACCCSTSRPPRSTPPPPATSAPASRPGRRRPLRGAVDQPQHVRGGGGLRPGAVPLARQDPAARAIRRQLPARARRGQPRRPVRRRWRTRRCTTGRGPCAPAPRRA